MKLNVNLSIDIEDKHTETLIASLLEHIKGLKTAYAAKIDVAVERKSWFSF